MAKTKPVKISTPSVKKEKLYKVSIGVNENLVEKETDNILDALLDYPVPAVIKTEMLVTVTKGTKVRDIALKTFDSRRIFGNKNALEIFADKLLNLIG